MTPATPVPLELAALVVPADGKWLSSAGADAEWDKALAAATSVQPAYLRSFVRYQAAYMAERAKTYLDLSMVLYSDRKPAGVWPLAAYLDDAGWHITSHESPVRAPLLSASLSGGNEKRLTEACIEFVCALAARLGLPDVTTTAIVQDFRLEPFHQLQMERGARIGTTHTLSVDLSVDLEAILLSFRMTVRQRIKKGLATWDARVLERCRTPVFDEFRALHLAVAGRITRGEATWNLQHDALQAGEAFLVELREKDTHRLVGGGYFHTSRSDAYYGVGVYDRTLFHLPLGHVVQYRAIEHMKKLGLRWYWVGARPYPQDIPPPTEKEVQIAHFKEGFAMHLQPVFTMTFPTPPPLRADDVTDTKEVGPPPTA